MAADRNPAREAAAKMAPVYTAFRFDSAQDLAQFDLAPTSAFQTSRFTGALFDTIGRADGAEPVVMGVRDGAGRLVAVLPFALRQRMGARVLEALDFHVVDYFAPTLCPNHVHDADALWTAVLAALPQADAITLKKIPQKLHGRRHALTGASWLRPMGTSAFVTMLGAKTELSRFSAARDARRKMRKLAALGKVEFNEVCEQENIAALLKTMFDYRVRRFAELGRPDPLSEPSYRAFYERLAVGSTPLARLFALKVDGEIVGIVYTLDHDQVLTLLIPTFSPDAKWSAGSPGLVALFGALEWAIAHQRDTFDLSVGSSAYKARFDAEHLELFEYQKALTARGIAVVIDAALRRKMRHLVRERPQIRAMLERLQQFGRPGLGQR